MIMLSLPSRFPVKYEQVAKIGNNMVSHSYPSHTGRNHKKGARTYVYSL